MSPYVVPDHVLERNLPTSLTPTFWGPLTVISFDSLDTDSDSPQSSVIPENHLVSQLSAPLDESENAITPLSKPVNSRVVPLPRVYFDDGNITFRVRLCAYRFCCRLIWRRLQRSREFYIASIGQYFVANRRNLRISFRSYPPSKSPRPSPSFL